MGNNPVLMIVLLVFFQHSMLVRSRSHHHEKGVFNVLHYGAVGDGKSDDTQAFMDAWKDTCNYKGSKSTMRIPDGKSFLLQPIDFSGPCNSKKIDYWIDGKLIAPKNPHEWKCENHEKCEKWIRFEHIDGLNIDGQGILDGQGPRWWSLSCEDDGIVCQRRPRGVIIAHSNNVNISNILVRDSPNFQITIQRSTWVRANDLTITADGDSPNTDGIHVQSSQNVNISDSNIGTGDDCISIGDGSKHVIINGILCGPGHGISIGSLGRDGSEDTVEYVHVRNATFRNTTNGVRIKTWQGGKGYARNIVFEHITSYGSRNPIIIDQFYCDHSHCTDHISAVRISNVIYRSIHGTSRDKPAIQLSCSKTVPCKNIYMVDINLSLEGKSDYGSDQLSYCTNVKGNFDGVVKPKVTCLNSKKY